MPPEWLGYLEKVYLTDYLLRGLFQLIAFGGKTVPRHCFQKCCQRIQQNVTLEAEPLDIRVWQGIVGITT